MAKKKEVKKEENPLYMKICEDSRKCEVPSKTVDLEDMILEVCPQCYNKRSWCKKEVVKTVKEKKGKEAPQEAINVETIPVAMPVISAPALQDIVAPNLSEMDEEIKRNAEATQAMFASVDTMVADVVHEIPVAVEAVPVPPIPAPVANVPLGTPIIPIAAVPPVVQTPREARAIIVSVEIKSATEAALICETQLKKRFVVKATSEPEKIQMLASNPGLVIGMHAKFEFTELNPDGTPVSTKYIAIVPPTQ